MNTKIVLCYISIFPLNMWSKMYKLPSGNIDRFLTVIDFCRNSALSFLPVLGFNVWNSLAIVLCVVGGAISIVAAGNVLM